MPRLVLISDTHGLHDKIKSIPDGDILIHAGDLSNKGDLKEVVLFNKWLKTLPHKHKIIIAGNCDFCFQKTPELARQEITNAIYLEDSSVELEGLKFYGSPWQPWFFDWAFNEKRGMPLKKIWSKIPIDTDVLITHGPPYGILDSVAKGGNVGCEELHKAIVERPNIKLHVFGHIHEAYGEEVENGVRYVNASLCSLQYQIVNLAVVVDL
jgi:Icc-related predicted phosphoesterase